ncbi:MAG: hypothetical protein G01um1014106_377 [Parcubacteria group bacterium Gr01-1014_106]|nr:MAG: hypothetical protein G01um1014106_377 [Parcubacteria group bacterium Gr01-1014_106]
MRCAVALIGTLLMFGVAHWPALAHEIAAHKALTEAAVHLLAARDPRFAGKANALSSILKLGVEREDDFLDSAFIGRFFFHFVPALDTPAAFADCGALQWGFKSSLEPTSCTATLLPVFPPQRSAANDYTYECSKAGVSPQRRKSNPSIVAWRAV